MADQYPITLAEFRAWLETKRPRAVVGTRQDTMTCPIAGYLKARGDHEYPEVTPMTIWTGSRLLTPSWAFEFLSLVDRRPGPITAGTALRLLERVEATE